MATIENKVHELWVLPKDGDEYCFLGVIYGPHPEMDMDFIFYRESESTKGRCGVRKDSIQAFKLVACENCSEAEESIGLNGNHDLKVEDFATQRCFLK